MSKLKYHKWLCEKLNTLANLQRRQKALSKHERQYIRNVQYRISTLFNDSAISSADIPKYQNIVESYGFTIEQVKGKQPIFYGKITPQVRFIDEGEVAVVWLGKYKLKACA